MERAPQREQRSREHRPVAVSKPHSGRVTDSRDAYILGAAARQSVSAQCLEKQHGGQHVATSHSGYARGKSSEDRKPKGVPV